MTPLSDALTAAQKAALLALQKAYVAGHVESGDVTEKLRECGITDPTDLAFWLASLDVLKEWGAPVPQSNGKPREDAPATDAQWSRIRADCKRANLPEPTGPLSKAGASDVIGKLERGEYDPAAEWVLPF